MKDFWNCNGQKCLKFKGQKLYEIFSSKKIIQNLTVIKNSKNHSEIQELLLIQVQLNETFSDLKKPLPKTFKNSSQGHSSQ